jgi:hypothetical protein
MNIKLIRKELLPGEKPKEITRLAIGLPGGMDAEAEKWLTEAKAFCLPCQQQFSLENAKVNSIV